MKKCEVRDSLSVGAKASDEKNANHVKELHEPSPISPFNSLANSAPSSFSFSSSSCSSSSSSSSTPVVPPTSSVKSILAVMKKKSAAMFAGIKLLQKPGNAIQKAQPSSASKSPVKKKSKKPCKLTKKATSTLATKRRFSLTPHKDKRLKKAKPLGVEMIVPSVAAVAVTNDVAPVVSSAPAPAGEVAKTAVTDSDPIKSDYNPDAVQVQASTSTKTVVKAKQIRRKKIPGIGIAVMASMTAIKKIAAISAVKSNKTMINIQSSAPPCAAMTGIVAIKRPTIIKIKASPYVVPSSASSGPLPAVPVPASTHILPASSLPVPLPAPTPVLSFSSHPLIPSPSLSPPIKLPVPIPALLVTVPARPLPIPALPLPVPVLPLPLSALPVPALPLPVSALPLPVPALPLPVSALPLSVSALPLPVPAFTLPVSALPLPVPAFTLPVPALPLSVPAQPSTKASTPPVTASKSQHSLSSPIALLLSSNNTTTVHEKQKIRSKSAAVIPVTVPRLVEASVLIASPLKRKSPLQQGQGPMDSILSISKPIENVPPASECMSALNSYFAGGGRTRLHDSDINETKSPLIDSGLDIDLNGMNKKNRKLLESIANCETLLNGRSSRDVCSENRGDGRDGVAPTLNVETIDDRISGTICGDSGVLTITDISQRCGPNGDTLDLTDNETPQKGRYFETPPLFLDSDFPRS